MTLRIDGRDVTALRIDGRDVTEVRFNGATVFPPPFDPEAGLTLSGQFSAGILDPEIDPFTDADVVMATTTTIPSAAGGVLFEHGGGGRGLLVAMKTSTTLRVRAGNGTDPPSASATALIDVDVTAFQDGQPHRIVWDARISPGRVRVWIDGAFQGEGTSSGSLGGSNNTDWSGGGSGGFVTGQNANVSGEPNGPWGGVMAAAPDGLLSVYALGQLVAQP